MRRAAGSGAHTPSPSPGSGQARDLETTHQLSKEKCSFPAVMHGNCVLKSLISLFVCNTSEKYVR